MFMADLIVIDIVASVQLGVQFKLVENNFRS